jgi:hypothetical protein
VLAGSFRAGRSISYQQQHKTQVSTSFMPKAAAKNVKVVVHSAKQKPAHSGANSAKPAKHPGWSSFKRSANNYLATNLDPFAVHGAGIPDFDSRKSNCFHTEFKVNLDTGNTGTALALVRPALRNGLLVAGDDGAGGFHCVMTPGQYPASGRQAVLLDILDASDLNSVLRNGLAIRAVSMGLKVESIRPMTVAQGTTTIMPDIPGESVPINIESPTTAPGGIVAATGAVFVTPVINSTTDVKDAPDSFEASVLKEVTVCWTPELPNSGMYLAIAGTSTGTGSTGDQSGTDSVGFSEVLWANSTLGANTTYAAPRPITEATLVDGTSSYNVHGDDPLPCVAVLIDGQGGAVNDVVELTIVVNWEMLPRPTLALLLEPSFKPANPDELTQANNVLRQVPRVTYPNNRGEPGSYDPSMTAPLCSMLYDERVPRKAAVEGAGTSIWTKIKSGVGKLAGAIGKGLSGMPGIGGAIGQGANVLASILGN